MHKAKLYKYLGIEEIDGSQFIEQGRAQVENFDADLQVREEVTDVEREEAQFTAHTDDGTYDATYVVFATVVPQTVDER